MIQNLKCPNENVPRTLNCVLRRFLETLLHNTIFREDHTSCFASFQRELHGIEFEITAKM